MVLVFLWHFILLPLGVVIAVGQSLVASVARFVKQRPSSAAPDAPVPSRRQFLRTALVAAPPVATTTLTGVSLSQLNGFRIRPMHLKLSQLPPALDGLTIAHVTDIHAGRFTGEAVMLRIADATNNLHADLVLLTGDLINHALSDLPNALDIVRRLDARHGVYMCEGNHDLLESRLGFEQGVKQSGVVPLLVNESTTLTIRGCPIQLLGLRWGPGRGDVGIASSMRELLAQRVPDAFPILLAHHPHAFDPAAEAGIPLILSGHTHGGQLMLSPNLGFGPMMFRYWSGLYERSASKLVVSNGVGNWFPLRVNAPAEIVHLTLHRAA
jgi:hypothetical protein